MKVSEFIMTNKVPLGFAVIAIIAALISVGLFLNILNPKPFYLKFYGGILTGAAAILFALITFVFDEGSSYKSDEILGFTSKTKAQVEIIDQKANTSIEKLDLLQSENNSLRNEIIALQNDQIKKNKEILALSSKIIQQDKESQDLITGGASYPNLTHCQVTLFDKGVNALGNRLHLSFEIYNTGEYPLDNFKIRGYQVKDLRKADPVSLWTELSTSGLNIHSRFSNTSSIFNEGFNKINSPIISANYEILKAKQRETVGVIQLKESFEYYGINFYIESKRQDWIILLRLFRPIDNNEPVVYQAHKIMKVTANGLENVAEEIEPGFPTGIYNKFIWFKSELPKQWFKNRE